MAEQYGGDGQQDAGYRVGRCDHHLASDRVEQVAEQQRPQHIAGGERQDVPADLIRRRAIEVGQDQRVSEENRVVEERLRHHQAQAHQSAPTIGFKQSVRDFGKRRVAARAQPHFPSRRQRPAPRRLRFDASHDVIGRRGSSVRHQPTRAFWNPKSHNENHKSDCSADQEGEPPADCGVDDGGIEQNERATRTQRRADPETAVDEEIGPAAEPCRDDLLDCRIDGSVFAADAGAGEETEHYETPGVPGEPSGGGGKEVDGKRDREQLFTA